MNHNAAETWAISDINAPIFIIDTILGDGWRHCGCGDGIRTCEGCRRLAGADCGKSHGHRCAPHTFGGRALIQRGCSTSRSAGLCDRHLRSPRAYSSRSWGLCSCRLPCSGRRSLPSTSGRCRARAVDLRDGGSSSTGGHRPARSGHLPGTSGHGAGMSRRRLTYAAVQRHRGGRSASLGGSASNGNRRRKTSNLLPRPLLLREPDRQRAQRDQQQDEPRTTATARSLLFRHPPLARTIRCLLA